MIVINLLNRAATNPYIATRYNGVTYQIRTVKWEWHGIRMTTKDWNNNSITLSQINKVSNDSN